MNRRADIFSIPGIPELSTGDDLAKLIVEAAEAQRTPLRPGDIVVVAQKAVSKVEGAVVGLEDVTPSAFAARLARDTGKDPRLVEVVLGQSRRIVKMDRGVLISETLHGYVCANAGVDASNVPGEDRVTVLPRHPDGSAARIRAGLESAACRPLAVIVSDSFNRPWRVGSVNVAIGVSGLKPVRDMRGQVDDHGRTMRSTLVALADELASAAQLVMGEAGGIPAAVIRGVDFQVSEEGSAATLRDPARDLFR